MCRFSTALWKTENKTYEQPETNVSLCGNGSTRSISGQFCYIQITPKSCWFFLYCTEAPQIFTFFHRKTQTNSCVYIENGEFNFVIIKNPFLRAFNLIAIAVINFIQYAATQQLPIINRHIYLFIYIFDILYAIGGRKECICLL